ncbi:hypothetical protein CEE37_12090 [candidate division LCP-89 bacterium B3_LCP]|uniref:Uncharacterized protein n=1 Tax=candidate division LCP-89 bacterium B3_LCP TaxID=2012998 RepID=A0A532UUA5_UNCL8|nr:MAG: hypothetical protein CEE37_12090 [candidate division LCP-89 bacterium B3_LCP]
MRNPVAIDNNDLLRASGYTVAFITFRTDAIKQGRIIIVGRPDRSPIQDIPERLNQRFEQIPSM